MLLSNTPLSRAWQVTYIRTANTVEIRSADPRKQLCLMFVRDQFMSDEHLWRPDKDKEECQYESRSMQAGREF